MKGERQVIAALRGECARRGVPQPPAELERAYLRAVEAARQAAAERARATGAGRAAWWQEFREAVALLLAIRRSLGLTAGERREYVGVRAARQAAARALPEDSVFAPMPPPPGVRSKPN